jgi:CRP-like cAMP-binding protein
MGMSVSAQPDNHPFVRKIESVALFSLSEAEREALANLPMQVSDFDARQDIVRERDRPTRCFAVLDGIAAAYKMTDEGRRQVTAYYVPGDVPDFQSLHLEVLDCSIGAVTTLRIGSVSHNAIRGMFNEYPRLADAFWRTTLIEGSLAREWMLNNDRREAYARIAHLFCELMIRMDAVGLVSDQSVPLSVTQIELGDALGITPVHVNRVLKELRDKNLITLNGGTLTIHDWDKLVEVAEFDPTYLHLRSTDAKR